MSNYKKLHKDLLQVFLDNGGYKNQELKCILETLDVIKKIHHTKQSKLKNEHREICS